LTKPEYILILDAHPVDDGRIQKHIRFLQDRGSTVYHIHFIPYGSNPSVEDGRYSLFGEKSWHVNLHWKIRYKGLRLLNYIPLFSSRLARHTIDAIQTLEVPFAAKGIIHVHDPILLPLAKKIQGKWLVNAKIVYDRHEVYEDMKRFGGFGGYRLFEHIAGNSVSGVVVVSDLHKKAVTGFFPKALVTTVPNFPMAAFVDQKTVLDKIHSFAQTTPIICIYIGSLRQYLDRDIDLLLILADAILTEISAARFFIGGTCDDAGVERKLDLLQQKFKSRFTYLGPVPYDQVIQKTENAHIGFYLVKPDTGYWVPCSPNKIFEYLSCGVIPVIRADCDFKDEMRSCGLFFARNTSEAVIIDSVISLLKNPEEMKSRMELCLKIASNFAYENVSDRYRLLYETIIEK